jgi:tRNA (guanine-N7-)-methyltransferase
VTTTADRREKLLYGRRKGPKPSARQQRLREELLPVLTLQLRQGVDPQTYFSVAVHDVWLEVGFGAGEHLLWQATQHPNVGFIGAEPYEAGVAKLLSHLAEPAAQSVARERVRLYPGDAREVLANLPGASLGRVFILFPDPWPKTRHHKRRFMQTDMLGGLARAMRPGAELRFATDDAGYLTWTLERACAHRAFIWIAGRAADWLTRPLDWPATRYETKALHGPPHFLRFLRR